MKKAYKVTWISVASVIGVVIIAIVLALYLVLSSKRLTSLVNKHASKFITCDYNIGKVDLTLFKTFPDVGLEIDDLVLINPTKGWTSDTLAAIDECVVSVNLKKILFEDEIIVNSCQLNGGFINAFFDTEGNNNFDIFPPSEPSEPEAEEDGTSYPIDLEKLKINDVKIVYTDLSSNTVATIDGLGLSLKGIINGDVIDGDLKLNIKEVTANIEDTTTMKAGIKNISLDGKINMKGDDIKADATIATGALAFLMTGDEKIGANLNSFSLNYNGIVNNYEFVKGLAKLKINGLTMAMDDEKYADNADICLDIPIELDLNKYQAKFEKSEIKLNDIKVEFIGEATMKDDINLNMDLRTNAMIINDLINLIPERLR